MRRAAHNNTGFSLIELLMVLVIMGLLTAIVIPVYLGMKNKAKSSLLIKTAQSSLPELQLWIQSSLSADGSLRQVDTNFDGKIDASDKQNSELLNKVAETYAEGRNLNGDTSPWFPNESLWSVDNSMPKGKIILTQTSTSVIKVIGKDKDGNIIFENPIAAD